eukprot:TRINITY_DN1942_c0_g1_i1.p1 TRINITY_DN1942_c0_g1~~TRINITY_DN1942_c0_g1_i1.p1  ORF type:complete len:664 (-),score=209.19 TRINITY_DN1942_c0_g1_i1:318-2309(-)
MSQNPTPRHITQRRDARRDTPHDRDKERDKRREKEEEDSPSFRPSSSSSSSTIASASTTASGSTCTPTSSSSTTATTTSPPSPSVATASYPPSASSPSPAPIARRRTPFSTNHSEASSNSNTSNTSNTNTIPHEHEGHERHIASPLGKGREEEDIPGESQSPKKLRPESDEFESEEEFDEGNSNDNENETKTEYNISDLPRPMFYHILTFLPPRDICRMSQVCPEWNDLLQTRYIAPNQVWWKYCLILNNEVGKPTNLMNRTKCWKEEFKKIFTRARYKMQSESQPQLPTPLSTLQHQSVSTAFFGATGGNHNALADPSGPFAMALAVTLGKTLPAVPGNYIPPILRAKQEAAGSLQRGRRGMLMDAPILTKSLDSGSPISPSIAVSITSPEKENSIQNEEVTNLKESSSRDEIPVNIGSSHHSSDGDHHLSSQRPASLRKSNLSYTFSPSPPVQPLSSENRSHILGMISSVVVECPPTFSTSNATNTLNSPTTSSSRPDSPEKNRGSMRISAVAEPEALHSPPSARRNSNTSTTNSPLMSQHDSLGIKQQMNSPFSPSMTSVQKSPNLARNTKRETPHKLPPLVPLPKIIPDPKTSADKRNRTINPEAKHTTSPISSKEKQLRCLSLEKNPEHKAHTPTQIHEKKRMYELFFIISLSLQKTS